MTGKHIYVQLIDDVNGVTLASANTTAPPNSPACA